MTQRRGKDTRIKLIGAELTFSMSDSQFVQMRQPLDHYSDGAKDFRPVFAAFSVYQRRSLDRNFAAEGRPEKWAPLTESTIADRIRQGFGRGPILQRTRRLKRGFRFGWGPRSYRVTNRAPYFVHHQFGAPANNLPARPMLVLLSQDKAQFTRLARLHLTGERVR